MVVFNRYDDEEEQVIKYQRIFLEDVERLEIGLLATFFFFFLNGRCDLDVGSWSGVRIRYWMSVCVCVCSYSFVCVCVFVFVCM